ncbi:MAG: YeiH family protein [Pseudomonadales bacterium]
MEDAPALPAASARLRNLGLILCAAALPPLLWVGNPALALLVGATIAVMLDRQPLALSGILGKYFLQTAIVLLGLKLNLATLWALSAQYSWGVAVYVLGTLALGLLLGRLLQVEAPSSKLISSGTAICGGTTIATLSSVVRAQPHQTGVALAIVFLLNAVALFTFPAIGRALGLSQLEFGLWAALAIHDTSSVVATAALYGDEAAAVATTIKLGRTLWLIPLAFAVSVYEQAAARGVPGAPQQAPRLRVPGFILLFVAAAAVGSWLPLPQPLPELAGSLSKLLLVAALFLLGTEITRGTVRRIRGRVLWQALALWLVVAPATLGAVLYFA